MEGGRAVRGKRRKKGSTEEARKEGEGEREKANREDERIGDRIDMSVAS